PRERGRLFVREIGMTNGTVGIVCPGCDAARASASGASLIRDRQELGTRARCILAERTQCGERGGSERRTNLRLQQTITGCDPLFPIVIYNEPRNLRAYGDSDRFWRDERNAHFGETKPTILAKATSSSLRESHSKSAKRSSLTSLKRMSAPQIDA